MAFRPLTWAKGFFSEEAKGTSSVRLIMIAGALVPLIIWATLSLYLQAMQDFPPGLLAFIFAAMGAKGWQNYLETKKSIKVQESADETTQVRLQEK